VVVVFSHAQNGAREVETVNKKIAAGISNANITSGARWMRDNDAALRAEFIARGKQLPQPTDSNALAFSRAQGFLSFCVTQWNDARLAV
jgi:hypothetical protein